LNKFNFPHLAHRLLPLLLVGVLLGLAACTTQQPLSDQVVPGTTDTPGANLQPGAIIRIEVVVIGLLAVAAVVSIVTQRLQIPYTIGLVLVGLGLTLIGQDPVRAISPEIILALFIPPLVFDAAFQLHFADLRRNLSLILMMAIPGVILTTLLVGFLVSLGTEISLATAMVFGALIAATDPVSVTALFRSVGAPKRLQVLVEGESLFNDGTSMVIFRIVLAIALLGEFQLGKSVLQFFVMAGGGIATGFVIGASISLLLRQVNNHLAETTLTAVIAYGSYILAETMFGVSGVLAVVAAGITTSQVASTGMSPTTRTVVFNFWENVAFLANSFVFLFIGFQTKLSLLWENVWAIVWSILAVLVSRAAVVYGLSYFNKRDVPRNWWPILYWGGLRGAISLALVLSLSWNFPNRGQLQAMAFGVVLFTLLVQGLTIYPLMNRLGIIQRGESQLEYERQHALATSMRAAKSRLNSLHRRGMISEYVLNALNPMIEQKIETFTREEREALQTEASLRQRALGDAWRETLRARRNTLSGLYRDNIISDKIYFELVSEVDEMLQNEEKWPELDGIAGEVEDPRGE